jgi:DNA-directed RNA polymerase specialized sigma24 family protein
VTGFRSFLYSIARRTIRQFRSRSTRTSHVMPGMHSDAAAKIGTFDFGVDSLAQTIAFARGERCVHLSPLLRRCLGSSDATDDHGVSGFGRVLSRIR